MGVTYKLKNEVVEFILRQKRDNPHISCRKLVIAIQSAFGISVSKSSISTVIKEAHLSSPVGRTPADLGRSQKFTIPKEKKVQLFGDEFSVLKKDEQERRGETQFRPIAPTNFQPDDQGQENISFPTNPPVPILPQDIKNEELAYIQPSPPQESDLTTSQDKATLQRDVVEAQNETHEEIFQIKDMRPFFLRMALWEFFSKPILEEFFKRHTSLGENEIRIVDVLACLFPRSLNGPSKAMDPQNLWLWKLSGWDELPETDDVEAVERFLTTTKISKFDYLLELGYFCSLVSSVRLILSNNQHIILDGRYSSVDSRATKGFPVCPIERAVEETASFIRGNEILTLRCATPEKSKEILARLHSCFSFNHENPLKKIILMGTQDDQLLEFDQIPDKPRNFIISAAIPESDFEFLFGVPLEFIPEQVLGLPGAQYMFSDKMVELLETNEGHGFKFPVRMVIFKRQDLGFLEVSLTNISQSAYTAQEIGSLVMGPCQKLSENTVFDSNQTTLESLFASEAVEFTIWQAIEYLNEIIEEVMNLIFSQVVKDNKYFSTICSQEGCIVVGPRSIKFQIKSRTGSLNQDENDFSIILNIYRRITYNRKYIISFL